MVKDEGLLGADVTFNAGPKYPLEYGTIISVSVFETVALMQDGSTRTISYFEEPEKIGFSITKRYDTPNKKSPWAKTI